MQPKASLMYVSALNPVSGLFSWAPLQTSPSNVPPASGQVFTVKSITSGLLYDGTPSQFEVATISTLGVTLLVNAAGNGGALNVNSALYGRGNNALNLIAAGITQNLATRVSDNAILTTRPGEWTLTNAPAANTVATATRVAAGGNALNVLTSICADITAVAAIAAPLTLVVRDGATGVGTILWQRRLTALNGTTYSVELSGLNIIGSANTAMTVEFTAAPGVTNFETISATGYTATSG